MNDNDNIILFPTNRIKDKQNVGKNIDEREHRKIVEKQTKEFVEGNVDEIAYSLLDRFVNMGIRTDKLTFTADLALVIDAIRGLVYRDFNRPHPAQNFADKMVTIKTTGKMKSARLDYSKILDVKHKPHRPLSRDVEDEVRDMSDMADIQFTPDFDPEDK